MKKSNPESVYERIVEITNTYDDDYLLCVVYIITHIKKGFLSVAG